MDFVHDQLACGRRLRILNIVDDVTRECLAAILDTSISGRRVARELAALVQRRGKPGMIVSDNGTEFTSNAMFAWAPLILVTPELVSSAITLCCGIHCISPHRLLRATIQSAAPTLPY